ncbi:MAG: ABC transporter ATP-binding protein [candidate division Zixibacteria bacterium]|nr:ABC transporter ATP-binding protein [candidate division Zixibacteria bacterium]
MIMTQESTSQYSAAVEIKNLFFAYNDGPLVLKDISLMVQPGEKLGIIGPSGAGKSTLLLHLNGILQGRGNVRIGGVRIEKDNLKAVRRLVGLVFQNPDDQLFNPTVEEDVAFGPLNAGLEPEEVSRRVSEVLTRLRLAGFEKKVSHHLSYGERKRVALATVLAMDPKVVAFDEPFANLDPAMVGQLIDTIIELKSTVVVVSQSILPVCACCDRLAVLNEGEIIAVGDARKIAADRDLLKSCGLDYSFLCRLCRELSLSENG